MPDPLSFSNSTLLSNIVLRGGLSLWIALPLIALALCAVFAVYFRESMQMHIARRVAMALLRGLAITSIILLLCKPVIISQEPANKALPVALMIDNSQSMLQRDPHTAPEDILRKGIAWNILSPNHDISVSPDEAEKIQKAAENPTRADVVMAVFQNPQLNLREALRQKGRCRNISSGAIAWHGQRLGAQHPRQRIENRPALFNQPVAAARRQRASHRDRCRHRWHR